MPYVFSLIPGLALYAGFYFTHASEMNLVLRDLGRVSFFYIALALAVTPLIALFGWRKLMPYRRVFGILAAVFALLHTLKFFLIEYSFHKTFIVLKDLAEWDVATGLVAFGIIAILWLTSNDASVRFLRSGWKKLQRLTYPLFLLVAFHVAFASRFEGFYVVIISALVFLRLAAYLKWKPVLDWRSSMKWGSSLPDVTANGKRASRYLCVPCGYIYDESVGDIDGGIAPGTRFEDIPDDWVCPVCGVGKADFIALPELEDGNVPTAEIVSLKYLNPTTLELEVEASFDASSLPGQYAKIGLKDSDGNFSRSYSIVSQKGRKYLFCMKLDPKGRAWLKLPNLKVGETLGFEWPFGNFLLEKTSAPKVFLATGTGLAPIMNMMRSIPDTQKHLFFSVRKSNELFYETALKDIPLLETHIFLSGEELAPYRTGRISLENTNFSLDTEFYLCGSPSMIETMTEKLKSLGYTKIFFEKF